MHLLAVFGFNLEPKLRSLASLSEKMKKKWGEKNKQTNCVVDQFSPAVLCRCYNLVLMMFLFLRSKAASTSTTAQTRKKKNPILKSMLLLEQM